MLSKIVTLACALILGMSVLFAFHARATHGGLHNAIIDNPAETAFSKKIDQWFQQFAGMELVGMSVFGTSHYGLSEEASNDWKRLTPAGGHLVRFSPGVNVTMSDVDTEVNFTVALFHQLKCLEIYRQEYIAEPAKPPSALVRHCLNYLRQQILCRLNLKLESTKDLHAKSARQYDTVCRDWTLVYEAAEKNHQSWVVHPA